MNNKVVLFDLDGTLVNTDLLIIRSFINLFDKYRPDYKLTLKEILSFLGPTLKETFSKYFKEDFSILLKEYRDYFNKFFSRYICLYDGVEEMLENFKNNGIKMGIVTNRFRNSAYDIIAPFDIEKYFSVIIGLEDMEEGKPSPDGINKALALLNVNKEDVIYVGDNKSDFEAAKNAEVKTALISWSIGKDNSLLNPDYLINSYNEFAKEILYD